MSRRKDHRRASRCADPVGFRDELKLHCLHRDYRGLNRIAHRPALWPPLTTSRCPVGEYANEATKYGRVGGDPIGTVEGLDYILVVLSMGCEHHAAIGQGHQGVEVDLCCGVEVQPGRHRSAARVNPVEATAPDCRDDVAALPDESDRATRIGKIRDNERLSPRCSDLANLTVGRGERHRRCIGRPGEHLRAGRYRSEVLRSEIVQTSDEQVIPGDIGDAAAVGRKLDGAEYDTPVAGNDSSSFRRGGLASGFSSQTAPAASDGHSTPQRSLPLLIPIVSGGLQARLGFDSSTASSSSPGITDIA